MSRYTLWCLQTNRRILHPIFLVLLCVWLGTKLYIYARALVLLESYVERLQYYSATPILDLGPELETKSSPTVNLVVSALKADNLSWTSEITIPNLTVIPYIADSATARYRPALNKGNEAMIYHTYFYEHYNDLPDITILTHSSDQQWHVDSILDHSVVYALSHLDLYEVQARGYANLHISWRPGCPSWIHPNAPEKRNGKPEEHLMRTALLENFFEGSEQEAVIPDVLAQPCCSQFAVTRDTVRSVPREKYAHFIKKLELSSIDDFRLGRTWEYMFHYLFTNRPVDCPVERKAFCKMYHICFEDIESWNTYVKMEWERSDLGEDLRPGIVKRVYQWVLGMEAVKKRQLAAVAATINLVRSEALAKGRSQKTRDILAKDLYD